MGILRKKPDHAIIVIVRRVDGYTVTKRIKNSARTVALTTQYHARHPDYFVYRVNIKLKNSPAPAHRRSGNIEEQSKDKENG